MRLSLDDPLPPEDWPGFRRSRTTLEILYRAQSARLARFFARRGANDDAQDMMQEAFRRYIGAARDPLRSVESPEAYLTRIADNLIRERARSAQERGRAKHVVIDDVILPALDPHPQLEQRDALARAEAALLTMRERTRDIFLMHRVQGMSYAEIATTRGMSVKAVEKQMSKALAALRRAGARG